MKEPIIICVDDEEIVTRSLKRELNDTLGDEYIIETAEGGKDALELFEELLEEGHEVPLVIADQIMPDIKGDELLKRIHAISPKTLKVMLTGQADMEAVTNAVNYADLYRYIAKPWERTDLIMTVKEALKRYFQDKKLEEQNKILQNVNIILEQQVKERTAELETQKIELEKRNVQLYELNASKDKFFSIIAHDLRSPFNVLLGYTDIISENIETYNQEELKEDVINLQTAAKRLYNLLENLLAWSRIQRGMIEYVPELINLYEIAQDNIYLFTSRAKQKQITLRTLIQQETMAYADYNMVNTVVRNLTSNALKFTSAGGSITLSAKQDGESVEISVSDTGTGIPETTLSQLFRIDTKYKRSGTAGEEGTGLGLILCKELVERNFGRIWVESKVGEGTTFRFTLPLPPS